jgi:predicted Fe-Mo cluster-binding NifX family protein
MKIAVTYENGEVFQHFGHTAQFKIYDTQDGYVLSAVVVDTNGHGHGALAAYLKEQQVDALICGGIGGCARTALAEANIRFYGGVTGSADEAVEALLAGDLEYDPCAQCKHHGEGHSCGSHSCAH